jgi:hypothetical protein
LKINKLIFEDQYLLVSLLKQSGAGNAESSPEEKALKPAQ